MKTWLKRIVWIGIAAAVGVLLVRSFRTAPVLIDAAEVHRGGLRVTVDDDGRTRVRERYTIDAPIAGRLVRTALDPGDEVEAGETVVAEFVPVAPTLLDVRSRSEAEARLGRAEAAVAEAEARREQAATDHEFEQDELERATELYEQGIRTREELDRAQYEERRTFQSLRAAELAAQVARYEVDVARASLVEVNAPEEGQDIDELRGGGVEIARDGRLFLRSPINGKVLRVFEESARALAAGTPILEVGATSSLEIVADYLSQEAVKVRPGMQVRIVGWGGEEPGGKERELEGRVRVVEPGGFTKVSALGVEEQRVNIVVDPVSSDEADDDLWAELGDGYRVELRIVLWEAEDVLVVPTGALFREGEAWSAFVVVDGVAERRDVALGRMNGLEAQIVDGLSEGDVVVLYPSELIGEGTPVEAR